MVKLSFTDQEWEKVRPCIGDLPTGQAVRVLLLELVEKQRVPSDRMDLVDPGTQSTQQLRETTPVAPTPLSSSSEAPDPEGPDLTPGLEVWPTDAPLGEIQEAVRRAALKAAAVEWPGANLAAVVLRLGRYWAGLSYQAQTGKKQRRGGLEVWVADQLVRYAKWERTDMRVEVAKAGAAGLPGGYTGDKKSLHGGYTFQELDELYRSHPDRFAMEKHEWVESRGWERASERELAAPPAAESQASLDLDPDDDVPF